MREYPGKVAHVGGAPPAPRPARLRAGSGEGSRVEKSKRLLRSTPSLSQRSLASAAQPSVRLLAGATMSWSQSFFSFANRVRTRTTHRSSPRGSRITSTPAKLYECQ